MIIDISKELFFILFILAFLCLLILKKQKPNTLKFWIHFTFIVYLICLIDVTQFPIRFYDSETLKELKAGIGDYIVYYQLIPFHSIKNYFVTGVGTELQIIGNVILLIPFVIYLDLMFHDKLSPLKEIGITLICSFVIEMLQFLFNSITGFPSRVVDIDDIILNTFGGIIAVIVIIIIRKLFQKKTGHQ